MAEGASAARELGHDRRTAIGENSRAVTRSNDRMLGARAFPTCCAYLCSAHVLR
jgi:hypothetical protein